MPGTITDSHPAADTQDGPADHECLRCYVTRMLEKHGCDNTKRWTTRWRDRRASKDKRFMRRIEDRGGICCDCEVIFNVWDNDPERDFPMPCSGSSHADPLVPCESWSARPDTLVREPDDDYQDYEEECW